MSKNTQGIKQPPSQKHHAEALTLAWTPVQTSPGEDSVSGYIVGTTSPLQMIGVDVVQRESTGWWRVGLSLGRGVQGDQGPGVEGR